MSLVTSLKNPVTVKQWLQSADGKELVGYFRDLMAASMRQCVNHKATLDEIRYAQGSYDAAKKLVSLEDDIQQYLNDIRDGKIKPAQAGEGAKK